MSRKPTGKTVHFDDGSRSVRGKNGNGQGSVYFNEAKQAWQASYALAGETLRGDPPAVCAGQNARSGDGAEG